MVMQLDTSKIPHTIVEFVRASVQAGAADELELRFVGTPPAEVDRWAARGKTDELVTLVWEAARADNELGKHDVERRYNLVRWKDGAEKARLPFAFPARLAAAGDPMTFAMLQLKHVEARDLSQDASNSALNKNFLEFIKTQNDTHAAQVSRLEASNKGLSEELDRTRKYVAETEKRSAQTIDSVTGKYFDAMKMYEAVSSAKGERDLALAKQKGKDERMDRLTGAFEKVVVPMLAGKLREAMSLPKQLPPAPTTAGASPAPAAAPAAAAPLSPADQLIEWMMSLEPATVERMMNQLPEDKQAEFLGIAAQLEGIFQARTVANGATHGASPS